MGFQRFSPGKIYENQEQNGENSDHMVSDSMTHPKSNFMILPHTTSNLMTLPPQVIS